MYRFGFCVHLLISLKRQQHHCRCCCCRCRRCSYCRYGTGDDTMLTMLLMMVMMMTTPTCRLATTTTSSTLTTAAAAAAAALPTDLNSEFKCSHLLQQGQECSSHPQHGSKRVWPTSMQFRSFCKASKWPCQPGRSSHSYSKFIDLC